MLRCIVQEHPKLWDEILGQAEFAYNSMTNRSSGRSPFSIVYTKQPNHTIDIAVLPKCSSKPASSFANQFSSMLQEVRAKLLESNNKYKQKADEHRREQLYKLGDLVMVRLRRERVAPGTYSKLSPRKTGPFPILKQINPNAYVVDLPTHFNTSTTFNVTDLSPYHPPDDARTNISSSESDSPVDGGE
ncbi:hypothetical protein MA16_Dca010600 [Dendrobium catenatum]|uniref:Tf2-1-like SH3-like domain-containing protein n=1 Tax=Dendrobium catenatum TaxID=906689 RepID=A0A2I0VZM2_9ASPA|nr:hypothetical protein MA16_Dca010600 [Dendrobium catenatum]